MIGRDPDIGRLSLLARTPTETFAIRLLVLAPGTERVFDEHEWRDSLVEIECGQVELELRGGDRQLFESGDVLWLAGLPIVALHNRGRDRAMLVAASRCDVGTRSSS
jgi:hypothetical protein